MQVKINKLPKSVIEIEGEINIDTFESYYDKAIKHLGEHIEIPGFRKGKIPENILLQNVPEIKILEEMAELALGEHYPKIIEDEKLDVISRPEISITKLGRKNPLGFKIITTVLPDITLPDYKKIAKNILDALTPEDKSVEVSDEELENTITDIRKSRAPKMHVAEGANPDIKPEDIKTELPELNDEFVQALGPFENVADFKEKLKENLILEKGNTNKEKTRLKIIEKIIDDSTLEVPEILTNMELDKIMYKMESDITNMGLKFEDYLKHLSKTVPDLRKEFSKDAEKKAKLALILNKIADVEKITPSEEDINREVDMILAHYKDADPERAKTHAFNVLTNEKIFQFLENPN